MKHQMDDTIIKSETTNNTTLCDQRDLVQMSDLVFEYGYDRDDVVVRRDAVKMVCEKTLIHVESENPN